LARPKLNFTTPISTPPGPPHSAPAYVPCARDANARFRRLDGDDVRFLTGTDEHGLKMEQTARRQGISPRELSDQMTPRFQEMAKFLNISNDDFIRTTEARHKAAVTELWRRMEAAGDIYLDAYSGWYSVRDEAYYGEEETALGADGIRLSPQGSPVEWVEEQSYFFRLAAYQDRLLELYAERPDFIQPESRRNEVLSFVRQGLRDLSVSRKSLTWGIPVPGDPGHVMYVWVDALTNYVSATGFPDEASPTFRYWPADLHVIGKDIVRFHTVYWPAFLMSAGLPLPKQVYAHGFLNVRGEKMSKSVGNVVDPFALGRTYGVDQIRYFFLREVPFGQDGNYSHEAMVNRINSDLANDFGNLAQRSLSMIARNCAGATPEPGPFNEADGKLLAAARGLLAKARVEMQGLAIHRMIELIWGVVGDANRYVDAQAPWALRKTDPARMATVLYVLAETIRQLAILAQPIVPAGAAAILDQLAVPAGARDFAALVVPLAPGTKLPAPQAAFPRYIDDEAARTAG
jgi:methionyl-tRNA synthetase